jgi:hypothetical protein
MPIVLSRGRLVLALQSVGVVRLLIPPALFASMGGEKGVAETGFNVPSRGAQPRSNLLRNLGIAASGA